MCMGYAKDIKAWACPQEMERRQAALHQWGDLLHLEDDAAQASDSAPPVADKMDALGRVPERAPAA